MQGLRGGGRGPALPGAQASPPLPQDPGNPKPGRATWEETLPITTRDPHPLGTRPAQQSCQLCGERQARPGPPLPGRLRAQPGMLGTASGLPAPHLASPNPASCLRGEAALGDPRPECRPRGWTGAPAGLALHPSRSSGGSGPLGVSPVPRRTTHKPPSLRSWDPSGGLSPAEGSPGGPLSVLGRGATPDASSGWANMMAPVPQGRPQTGRDREAAQGHQTWARTRDGAGTGALRPGQRSRPPGSQSC